MESPIWYGSWTDCEVSLVVSCAIALICVWRSCIRAVSGSGDIVRGCGALRGVDRPRAEVDGVCVLGIDGLMVMGACCTG